MECSVTETQLWSWVDRAAPELEPHLQQCARCRALAAQYRTAIHAVEVGGLPDAPPLPTQIGNYIVTGLLGEGGQGVVYRAEQLSPRRTVALKVLRGGHCAAPSERRHFDREIKALASVTHPAVAAIYEAGQTALGQCFFAMELVEGEALDGYVRHQKLTIPARLELFGRVCDGVASVHARGIVHRDLKPSNILITAEGNPRILDFGLARVSRADMTVTQDMTTAGHVVGTLQYMSPEQARGESDAGDDVRTDVYALGVILYELLTGQRPYELGPMLPQAAATISETPPRRPSSICAALRGDLETIILKGLAKDASARFQAVAELAVDIRRYLASEPILARPPSTAYKLRKRIARHPVGFGVAAVALVIGLAVPVWVVEAKERELDTARRQAVRIQWDVEAGRENETFSQARAFYQAYKTLPEALLIVAQAEYRTGLRTRDQYWCNCALAELRGMDPRYEWAAQLLRAEIYDLTDPNKAAAARAAGLSAAPDTAEAWHLRSFATLDTHAAQECAAQATQRDPRLTRAWLRLAYLGMLNRAADTAVGAADRLVDLTGDVETWKLFSAHALTFAGRYQQAVDRYNSLTYARSRDLPVYRHRAIARLCMKDYVGAAEDYTREVELSGSSPALSLLYERATPLQILGRLDDAIADYDRVWDVQAFVSHAAARLFIVLHDRAAYRAALGMASAAQDDLSRAQTALEKARRGAASGSFLERILACLAGDLTAQQLVDGADPLDVEQVCEAYYYAGEACRLNGETEAAMEWFRKCQKTDLLFDRDCYPLDPMNEYHLALWRLDAMSEAESGAVRSDP